jgi:hypothetical protein
MRMLLEDFTYKVLAFGSTHSEFVCFLYDDQA